MSNPEQVIPALDTSSPTERLASGEFYLYDPEIIAALREKVGESPVVVFNGMHTLYASPEGEPDGKRIPFEEVQETINKLKNQIPELFVIGWTGKGPRMNVYNAVGDTAHLIIGESNLTVPNGKTSDQVRQDYTTLVNSASWLTLQSKSDLIEQGPSQSVKDPQLFARGKIVIIDRVTNKPGLNHPSIEFIDSNLWAQTKRLPRSELVSQVTAILQPPTRR